MNRDSNIYTISYATIMVILVAIALAFTSQTLKSRQQENEKMDKMEQILRSIDVSVSSKDKVTETYKSIIKKELLIQIDGKILQSFEGDQLTSNDAFSLNTSKQFKLIRKEGDAQKRALMHIPLYVAEVNGNRKYIIPLNGNGLWGAIWGYISINSDRKTIGGADFGHAGETPGLGAEIATKKFSQQFIGKNIKSLNGNVIGIAVVKGGKASDERAFVDAISGGTLTSNGVDEMLTFCLKCYDKYLTTTNN